MRILSRFRRRPALSPALRAVAADLAEETLRSAGHVTLRVTGSSMTPAIRSGSRVEIRSASADAARPGDIVLLRMGQGFRLHRLVQCAGNCVVTRGDNLKQNDPPEPSERLLGIAVRVFGDCSR